MNEIKWSDQAFIREEKKTEEPTRIKLDEYIEYVPTVEDEEEWSEGQRPMPKEDYSIVQAFYAADTYSEALRLLDEHYSEIINLIPVGAGNFEAWWTGSMGGGEYAESPDRILTVKDVENLDPSEVACLLSNLFYNSSIDSDNIEKEALSFLIEKALELENTDMLGIIVDDMIDLDLSPGEVKELTNNPLAKKLFKKHAVDGFYAE